MYEIYIRLDSTVLLLKLRIRNLYYDGASGVVTEPEVVTWRVLWVFPRVKEDVHYFLSEESSLGSKKRKIHPRVLVEGNSRRDCNISSLNKL